jgi:LPXTG-motif cell wall-anchored protein
MAKRLVGLLALTTMLLGAFALVSPPAQAQEACDIEAAYQGTATFGTNLTVVSAGGEIVFEGTGWPPNVTLQISVNGQQIGSVTTNAQGSWSFTYTVPANASGTQTAEVSCGSFVLSTQFNVIGAAGPITGGTTTPLPVTGSDSLSWVQMGIALIALGAVLVYLTRRRSQQAALVQHN